MSHILGLYSKSHLKNDRLTLYRSGGVVSLVPWLPCWSVRLVGQTGRSPWKTFAVPCKGDNVPSTQKTFLNSLNFQRMVSLSLFFSGQCLVKV